VAQVAQVVSAVAVQAAVWYLPAPQVEQVAQVVLVVAVQAAV
jgi:hypothetical protein